MRSRNLCASILATCLLAAGIGGLAPVANAAPAGQSLLNAGKSAGNGVIEIKRHRHGHGYRARSFVRPIAPSYLYYDYPYYASRGYYPSHIGPGFIYHYPVEYEGDADHASNDGDSDYASNEGAPYSAQERCARRFKSFDRDTGRYTTYGGQQKVCPYLR